MQKISDQKRSNVDRIINGGLNSNKHELLIRYFIMWVIVRHERKRKSLPERLAPVPTSAVVPAYLFVRYN